MGVLGSSVLKKAIQEISRKQNLNLQELLRIEISNHVDMSGLNYRSLQHSGHCRLQLCCAENIRGEGKIYRGECGQCVVLSLTIILPGERIMMSGMILDSGHQGCPVMDGAHQSHHEDNLDTLYV